MAGITQSSICCLSRATFRASAPRLTASINRASYSTPAHRSVLRPSALFLSSTLQPSVSSAVIPLTRHSSTTSTSSPQASTTSSAETSALTWNEFLKLRRTRRYINLGASAASGLGSIVVAAPIMAEYELENIGAQMTGMDPVFVLGGSLVAVGAVGWLMGPFLGTAVFKIWKSSATVEFARKEKDFYTHIKRYRADPASSSVNNPVPDYYGEKISSVSDYRRWLKDQRAFNRKKNKNMI
ncbi:hypothetical protein MBLNU459_g8207t1 [Dothideomycetes sp. NU459]